MKYMAVAASYQHSTNSKHFALKRRST